MKNGSPIYTGGLKILYGLAFSIVACFSPYLSLKHKREAFLETYPLKNLLKKDYAFDISMMEWATDHKILLITKEFRSFPSNQNHLGFTDVCNCHKFV